MSEAIQSAADPAAVRVPLVAKDGHAVVGMVLANRDQVAVVATQLPSNENDQTYVLWGLSWRITCSADGLRRRARRARAALGTRGQRARAVHRLRGLARTGSARPCDAD